MEKNRENTIYTVGHSTIDIGEFLNLVKKYNVDCIVDVRSTPYSQFAPQFNRENLQYALKQDDIKYLYMGREFGARREDKTLYNDKGELDFVKVVESELFSKGISRVTKGIQKGYKIAFMCTEKEPMDCHRTIMVGRKFSDLGYNVINILHNGTSISQQELEKRLLDKYFPQRDQINIFSLLDQINEDEEVLTCKAYQYRNSEIAFNINDEEEHYEPVHNRVYEKNG